MNYIPKYIKRVIDKRQAEKVTNTEWNELFNLLINQGDYNTEAIETLAKGISDCLTKGQVDELISERVLEVGAADMIQAVYDTDSNGIVDKAESVVTGGVNTEALANGSVTIDKLESNLINKLNYSNSNIGAIMVQLNSKDQISGTEGMVLFGLDGTLETGSNIAVNKVAEQINTEGYTQGTFTLSHNIQNATSLLNTTDNYTLTNYYKYFKTKLSSVTNAVLSENYTSTTLNISSSSVNALGEGGQIVFMGNNVYLGYITDTFRRNKKDFPCIGIFKITWDGTNISKTQIHAEGFRSIKTMHKMGNYIFCSGDNYDTSGNHNFETLIAVVNPNGSWSDACIDLESYRLVDKVYCSDGGVLTVERNLESRTYYLTKKNFNTAQQGGAHKETDFASSEKGTISIEHQYSGKWVTVGIYNDTTAQKEYFLMNTHTGTKYPEPSWVGFEPDALDSDGIHFYYAGKKYRVDDTSRELVVVATISNYNLKTFYKNKQTISEGCYNKGNEVWAIENNRCTYLYSLPNVDTNAYNELAVDNQSKGVYLSFESTGVVVKPFTFTKGTITIPTANNESIPGPLTITRDQSCVIPAGQTKDIYLKVKTNNTTFTLANLICYFNRALTTSDSITVTFNDTALTPLSKSTDTIKYYSHTYTATSNIEILVRVKAGATALQVTQFLGGVDNGV